MKALFPKQTNFAVSNFLTKAERLQERYLKYWLNLLLCNSIASIAVLEQTKPAIFCLQNFCETFWNPKQLFCFSTTTKPHLLRVLHVVTHVKFSFCATILFKVWEGWVSSNNFYEDSKSAHPFHSHPFSLLYSSTFHFMPRTGETELINQSSSGQSWDLAPKHDWKKECFVESQHMSVVLLHSFLLCRFQWFSFFSRAST